jgi:hypothetical protein
VGVDDEREVVGVGVNPGSGLVGVADEPAIDQGGLRPVSRSRLASGRRLLLPGEPGGERRVGHDPWAVKRG